MRMNEKDNKMKPKEQKLVFASIMAILMLLIGCDPTSKSEMKHTSQPPPIPSPTSCTGWNCTLRGTVYADEVGHSNVLENIKVKLSQMSFCSPTSGEQESITNPDGEFEFAVYIHDTDTIRIDVEDSRYEPEERIIGGFDCLSCSCSSLEIVLRAK
jgi:hypothetical protein